MAPLGGATIAVKGISWTVTSGNTFGDYYRPLAPGTYTVQVRKTGYTTAQSTVTVPASGAGVVRDFVLKPSSVSSAGR